MRLRKSTDTYITKIEKTRTTCPYCGYRDDHTGDITNCKTRCDSCDAQFIVGEEE